tara:strand:- start:875 stop:1102 length:228 start_codon:yes stop_codon:yes gene_type:complete
MSATTITMDAKRPSLEEAQKAVGGYVEIITLREGQLLFDEEGLLKGLPHNHEASKMAGQLIVGNALLLKGSAKWD